MRDPILARMVDAAAALSIAGEPVTVRRVACEAGLPVSNVWRRWAKLGPCVDQAAPSGVNYGLGRADDAEVRRRIAIVREAKARRPSLDGLDSKTLDEILPD